MSTVVTRAYRAGTVVATDFAIDEIGAQLAEADTIVWVDIIDPHDADIQRLSVQLDFHDLAVEDALDWSQRPKIDHYDSHVFISTQALRLDDDARLCASEVDMFVGRHTIVTVRQHPTLDIREICRRAEENHELARSGVGAVVHAVLDVIVDQYFDLVDEFDEYYEQISDQLFRDEPLDPATQKHWFEMGRALGRFHRLAGPTSALLARLLSREPHIVNAAARPYFQDVYDHMLHVGESIDGLRELVTNLIEANLAMRADRQSRIAKHVSGWAGVVAVPTLITGFYGMNVPYPGAGETWGWWMALLTILGGSGALYAAFKRRDWL